MLLTYSISGQRYRVKSSTMRALLFLTLPSLLKYRLKYIKLHRALNVATTLGHHTLPPDSNQFTLDKSNPAHTKEHTQFKLNPSHPIPTITLPPLLPIPWPPPKSSSDRADKPADPKPDRSAHSTTCKARVHTETSTQQHSPAETKPGTWNLRSFPQTKLPVAPP